MTGRWLWVASLALTLSVLAVDGARRLRDIEAVSATRVGEGLRPEVDRDSPSGYRGGTHRIVLPETDSYFWLLQAEQALAGGELRVRTTELDNAPTGREVHWAGFQRWWLSGLAALDRLAHSDLTMPQSLERVAPWANTALLVVYLLALTPLVAGRFGAVPAAVLCLGCVAVFPFYRYLRVGFLDHHGPAILSAQACVLLAILGGAGWVRTDQMDPARATPEQRALWDWLPDARAARRWFVASGLAGALGLWISAATLAAVLLGVGLGGLLGVALSARGWTPPATVRLQSSLFRVWGISGAAASAALYLLEYFPVHVGMRLEVNHPLYALAFLGGGDLIARVLERVADRTRPRASLWIAADLGLILALPAVVLATGTRSFLPRDPVLWTLHNRYINEFLDLATVVQALTPSQVIGRVSLVVLVALPIAALLWSSTLDGAARIVWRTLVLALVGASAAYAWAFFLGLSGGAGAEAVVGTGAAVGSWFVLPLVGQPSRLAPPWLAALMLVALPAVVMLVLGLAQERWLGVAAALWLAALVVASAVWTRSRPSLSSSVSSRALTGALVLLALVISPAFALREPYSPPNSAVIARDASLWLRRRLGAERGVVFAGPSATSDMIWFGGFRGLGTLYWENLEGLRASAEICGATDDASARALLARHGVTHVAAYAWDGGLEQLQLSIDAAPGAPGWPRGSSGGIQGMCLHEPRDLPPWLEPLPYVPPTVAGYVHPVVRLFEVVDEPPPEVGLVRLARYYQALKDPRMEEALARSLELRPSVAGLAMAAQLRSARGDRAGADVTIDGLRGALLGAEPVEPADRLEAAIALALGRDGAGAAGQLEMALSKADEQALRRMPPERLSILIDLSRQMGLDRLHPGPIATAVELLRRP
jgi:hypothetical protein